MTAFRSFVFTAYLYGLTASMAVILSPLLLLPASSKASGAAIRLWARWLLAGLKVICGTTYEVRGRQHLPHGAALIASKHQAMWETVSFFHILDDPAFVLKRELMQIPFYGWFCKKAGMISIDRQAHATALRQMVKDARNQTALGRPVVIFPEGTRGEPGGRNDYKPGVAALYRQLDLPCIPVALNSGLFWRRGRPKRAGTIVVEFLPPIAPGLSRKDFMHTLENEIETASRRLVEEGCAQLGEAGAVPRPFAPEAKH